MLEFYLELKRLLKKYIRPIDDRIQSIVDILRNQLDFNQRVESKIETILNKIENIERKEDNLMSKFDTLEGFVQAVNAETNRIAGLVQDLLNQVSGGLSASEADQLISEAQPVVDALKAIGASNTPVVPEPPVETPPADTGTPPDSSGGVV